MQSLLRTKNLLLTCFFILLFINHAEACTRVLDNANQQSVIVGRNMDWFEDMKTNLWVYPQGIARHGLADINPIEWTSKYGSLVTNSYDNLASDGMNERGLAAHILWLDEADYGKRNPNIPGLSASLWAQYYLDNFQTVDEAIQFTEANAFQLVDFFYPPVQMWAKIHLALEDATGDSAIIEYVNGVAHIYHNRGYTVLTNSPTYDQQLLNLHKYKGFGGNLPLPGTTKPTDRFVRATYYDKNLANTVAIRDEIANVISVINNAAQPSQGSDPGTIWRVIADLTNKTYYFHSSTNMNMIWVNLSALNLRPGSPTLKLDMVDNPNLAGDVTKKFVPVT